MSHALSSWHLKVAFKLLDSQGASIGEGTYEEDWISPTRFKRSVNSTSFKQVQYGTENGTLVSGGEGPVPPPIAAIRRAFVNPLPEYETLKGKILEFDREKMGKSKVDCVRVRQKPEGHTASIIPEATFCFEKDHTFLRESIRYDTNILTVSDGEITYKGASLPHDIVMYQSGKPALVARLESIEPLQATDESVFSIPADARLLSEDQAASSASTATITDKAAESSLLVRVNPVYPPIAKAARVHGTVVLQALISRKGKIQELSVQSGPPMLQQAAMDAVKQWVYKPYMLDGKPVGVYTTISVVFNLSN